MSISYDKREAKVALDVFNKKCAELGAAQVRSTYYSSERYPYVNTTKPADAVKDVAVGLMRGNLLWRPFDVELRARDVPSRVSNIILRQGGLVIANVTANREATPQSAYNPYWAQHYNDLLIVRAYGLGNAAILMTSEGRAPVHSH
ncbi:MAG TPA: hypothetical protein VFK47_16345 [Ktedonobacteraceae bacterium]|nr:hypothetical protein [Ktedonobacteraceae bacterium]